MPRRSQFRPYAPVIGLSLLAAFALSRGDAAEQSTVPVQLRGGQRFISAAEAGPFLQAIAAAPEGLRGGIVQFAQLPKPGQIAALNTLGVQLSTYLPENAYIAAIPAGVTLAQLQAAGVRWIGELRSEDKLTEILRTSGVTPEWAVGDDGQPRFSVGLFPHVSLDDAATALEQEYGAVVTGRSRLGHSIEVKLPGDNWLEITNDRRVLWIEPFWPREACNNSNRANVRADVAQAVPYSLTGNAVVVGEWDEGRADPGHADFGGRIIAMDASSVSTHSTHVAGTVMGAGSPPSFTYKGMAPAATLLSYQWWFSTSEMEAEFQDAIDNIGLALATNSWIVGFDPPSVGNCNAFLGNYFSECEVVDDIIAGSLGKPVPIVWAAGNERSTGSQYCGSVGFTFGTVAPFATAKNVLTIGAINSNNSSMTGFSSWGPTDDGRLKPELVAPGCQTNDDFGVNSTKPGSGYISLCGTSMAAPTAAGCIAQWMQRYNQTYFTPPLASTVKAIFVESAVDLGDPGPEYDFGYGRIDVPEAVDALNEGRFLEDQISHGATKSWTFNNDGSLTEISVTLAWDDPGTTAVSGVTLINNLDLRLIPPSGPPQYRPWKLNPGNPSASATTGIDSLNNLEQVRRTTALEVGTWTVVVSGTNIPQGPQPFSLATSEGIALTSNNLAYAVRLTAGTDRVTMIGNVNLPFTLYNDGFNTDTYDVTLSSAHGWSITPNPSSVPLGAYASTPISFTMTVPPGTPYGTVDTVYGTAASTGSPGIEDTDTILVTVVSGRAITMGSMADTAGVPGRTISLSFELTNLGIAEDTINWSASENQGWSFSPTSGSVVLDPGGLSSVNFDLVIDNPETVGIINTIRVHAESQDDPGASDDDSAQVTVVAPPPPPIPVSPAAGSLLADASPTMVWTHDAYIPPPPGYNVFRYYVDVADDTAMTGNWTRFGPLADTSYVTPGLADGMHFWRIVTKNTLGDSSDASAPRRLEIDTQAPASPALDVPLAGWISDPTPLYSWLPVDAIQYLWESSPDSNFITDVDSLWTALTSYQTNPSTPIPTCSTVIFWRVSAIDAAGNRSAPSVPRRLQLYIPGDLNFDCLVDVVDVIREIGVAFRGEPYPIPQGRAEINCQEPIDIVDVIKLIEHAFRGGALPCFEP